MARVVIVTDAGDVVEGWEGSAYVRASSAGRGGVGSAFGMRWDGSFDRAWREALAADERAAQARESEEGPPAGDVCAACGMDLTLKQWQIEWLLEHGNPVPRPPCPKSANGLHRVELRASVR